jgi:hypothetical protein
MWVALKENWTELQKAEGIAVTPTISPIGMESSQDKRMRSGTETAVMRNCETCQQRRSVVGVCPYCIWKLRQLSSKKALSSAMTSALYKDWLLVAM